MRFAYHLPLTLSVALGLFVGCASQHDYTHLPAAEQERFRAYSQLMTSRQISTYLGLSTAAERAAFAKEIGVAQQLEALSPKEREAVLYGRVFEGMSGQALRLVWGKPCREEGPASHQRWIYHGPMFSLADVGWNCSRGDTITEVQLEHGKVQWFKERIPSTPRGRRY